MVAIIPFTRAVVGTSIGPGATIVPLVISAAPFVARMVESSLNEVNQGVIEAALAMGSSKIQIILKFFSRKQSHRFFWVEQSHWQLF